MFKNSFSEGSLGSGSIISNLKLSLNGILFPFKGTLKLEDEPTAKLIFCTSKGSSKIWNYSLFSNNFLASFIKVYIYRLIFLILIDVIFSIFCLPVSIKFFIHISSKTIRILSLANWVLSSKKLSESISTYFWFIFKTVFRGFYKGFSSSSTEVSWFQAPCFYIVLEELVYSFADDMFIIWEFELKRFTLS